MRSVLFWASLPWLVPQALRVRRTAPRFAGAAGPPSGSVGSGSGKRLIAVGDSIIAGVGASQLSRALVGETSRALAESLACRIEWRAAGRIGATSRDILRDLVPRLDPQRADFMLVSAGVNDITSLTRTRVWRRSLLRLIAELRRHSPDAIIGVAGIPPLGGFPLLPQPLRGLFGLRARQFDELARHVVSTVPRAVYVPIDFETSPEKFAADGYHPSEPSYREFGEAMAAGFAAVHRSEARAPAERGVG